VSGATVILLVTLLVGTFWQGAFYRPGQLAVGAGVAVAVVASVAARRPRVRELAAAPIPAMLALAGWIVLDAAVRGSGTEGVGGAALALGVVAVVVVVRRAPAADRELLASGLPAIGALLATTAWLGLVLHVPRWSLLAQGVRRGAGTLTYPNATAAMLVMLLLLALARCARPSSPGGGNGDRTAPPLVRPRAMRLMAMAMLLGAGTTMSRGGLLALVFGLAVALVLGGSAMARAVPGPLAGSVVGLAGALPATTSEGASAVLVAAIAAVAGAAVCELVTHLVQAVPAVGTATTGSAGRRGQRRLTHELRSRPGPGRRGLAVGGVLLVAVAIGGGVAVAPPRWGVVAAARLTISSAHRADATRAALAEVRDHVVAGVGPGDSSVTWRRADGAALTERYVHDEYLQVLLEYGAVGAGLLLAVLGSAAVAVVRAGHRTEMAGAAGAAAIAAFGVHSAMDFLWHLPVLPLLAATVLSVTLLPPMPSGATGTPLPQPFHDRLHHWRK
jgi:O-Antigen ligase